jgi:hypothetical protein
MSRKRKDTANPEDPTATPTATLESPVAHSEPALQPEGDGPGFAEKVGKRNWIPVPDPFTVATDTEAGVRLFENHKKRLVAIQFGDGRPEDKPSQPVIDKVREAGFQWNVTDRVWFHPVTEESARTARIEAEYLYQEVRQMIRQEKGIAPSQEIPF